jgi:hypothetical protein
MRDFVVILTLTLCASLALGVFEADIDSTGEDMHCQPITKHNTLEEAKAQVERYQAMVRG